MSISGFHFLSAIFTFLSAIVSLLSAMFIFLSAIISLLSAMFSFLSAITSLLSAIVSFLSAMLYSLSITSLLSACSYQRSSLFHHRFLTFINDCLTFINGSHFSFSDSPPLLSAMVTFISVSSLFYQRFSFSSFH